MKTAASDPDALAQMLTRMKPTAIRDQLDSLLDTATRRKLTLLDTVKLLCEAEVARKDERRIQIASSIAKFPFVRTLEGFEFAAQPSLGAKLVRELAKGGQNRMSLDSNTRHIASRCSPLRWIRPALERDARGRRSCRLHSRLVDVSPNG